MALLDKSAAPDQRDFEGVTVSAQPVTVVADCFVMAVKRSVAGLIQIDGLGEQRLTLADGRSWPSKECSVIVNDMGSVTAVILRATGETLWRAGATDGA